MRTLVLTAVAAAIAGTVASTGVANANAADGRLAATANQVQAGEVGVTYAQYRRYYRGGRYGYHRRGRGGSAAGLIGGLAAGALIGGAIASQQAQAAPPVVGSDAVSYCMQRFRSYDPESGTYLGNDGLRHPCP